MGMAASQARLLCLTARIHDIEYQAQSIQNAKLQLATQEDKAYREYNEALDATTLTIKTLNTNTGEKSTVPATFNNLCSSNKLTAANGQNYAIRNQQGLLIVEDEIEEAYFNFKNKDKSVDDPYVFAMYMLGMDTDAGTANNLTKENVETAELAVYQTNLPKSATPYYETLMELTGGNIYDRSKVDKEKLENYDKALSAFRKELYNNSMEEILAQATGADEDAPIPEIDSALFNYYVSIYNQIELCGGCVSIEDYNGMNGDAANDTEWLQAMIESGQLYVDLIETDPKTGEVGLERTSVASDSCLAFTTTTDIDKRALVKAEAEYESKLRQIDKKDQQFDLSLSKLEAERNALTTEYDSVKKVVEDNIDRTFKIFS